MRHFQIPALVLLISMSCNSYARLCTNLKGTLRSADARTANIKTADGKTIYTINMPKLNDKEISRLMRSVGQSVEICLDKSQFREALAPAK